jgi:hypothetical protein
LKEISINFFFSETNSVWIWRIIRNIFGHCFAGFSGFIQGSYDILFAGLYTIYKACLLARDMNIDELVCYSDSLHCVNLIKGPQIRYHIRVILIQNINELLSQTNVSLYHTLREGNQRVDLFLKLGAYSYADFLTNVSPPSGVHDLLKNDVMRTFLPRK